MNNIVIAKTFHTRMEAEVAKGFLEANNIQSVISADDDGGTAPFPLQPTYTGVKLLVKEADLLTARQLLK
jgi:hypothetical protein